MRLLAPMACPTNQSSRRQLNNCHKTWSIKHSRRETLRLLNRDQEGNYQEMWEVGSPPPWVIWRGRDLHRIWACLDGPLWLQAAEWLQVRESEINTQTLRTMFIKICQRMRPWIHNNQAEKVSALSELVTHLVDRIRKRENNSSLSY